MDKITPILLVLIPIFWPVCAYPQNMTATDIVRLADEKFNGEKSSHSVISLTVVRPKWERKIEFENWTMGREFALTLITSPAKEAGQSFLKRGNEMWNWNPSINRIVKLPPSMMSQGWMGSDYSNDDILKESSIVTDYDHELSGEETVGNRLCYKIKMIAKPGATIVWGKQLRWIEKKDLLMLKAELYDEDGYLVRTETAYDIKSMDGRMFPTKIELIPADEPLNKTVLEIREIKFNIHIEESFFSQQNLKKVR